MQYNMKRKQNGHSGKAEIQLSLFADGMIVCIEKPQRVNQKTLELVSDYSKAVGSKVNVYSSVTFLYVSNEQLEFKIKNIIPFTLAHT